MEAEMACKHDYRKKEVDGIYRLVCITCGHVASYKTELTKDELKKQIEDLRKANKQMAIKIKTLAKRQ